MASFGVSGNVYTNITVLDPFTDLKDDIDALAKADLSSAASAKDSDDVVELAEDAADIVNKLSSTDKAKYKLATTTIADQTFENLQTGYYLIVEESHGSSNVYLSTKYILVAVDENETVAIKTSKAGVTKKIVSEHDTSGATLVDADTVAIGDTVKYQLDAPIPDYDSDATELTFTLTDTMSSGLTFSGITSVQVSKNGSTWDNATSPTTNAEETGVKDTARATVTISLSLNDIINYSYVRVILTATLNSDASTGATGNPNSVKLQYTNDYYGGSSSYTTPWDTVITYTGELNILKVDSSNQSTGLSGATFNIRTTDDKTADALYFVKDGNGVYVYTKNSQASGATTDLVSDDNGV
ncbi:MAG: isopeptide-forming domain-containing fimbrial protein, partial [Clostridiales bacterium]|nr:isopeptide-forming domain-containing fimbrial protein [Clostridiales bacterium]